MDLLPHVGGSQNLPKSGDVGDGSSLVVFSGKAPVESLGDEVSQKLKIKCYITANCVKIQDLIGIRG